MLVSGTAYRLYPAHLFFGVLHLQDGGVAEIPEKMPFKGDWGEAISLHIIDNAPQSLPIYVDVVYLSVIEGHYYSITKRLPSECLEENSRRFDVSSANIVVGMAPYGGLAVWVSTKERSEIIAWLKGTEIKVSPDDYLPYEQPVSAEELCRKFINEDKEVQENLALNGLPPRDLFDNYMKQFTYRYQVILEHWDEDEEKWIKYDEEKDEVVPEFEYIEESLYDGTHDKLHDGGLMKYHEAGKPKKLALKWHIKKSDYSAYFWFDEEICAIFNKFYGQHPDTKTDFIIHIDPIKKKYELSLYRYGLKQPVIIPESAYQLIVFKSGFENYRSDNYNQPTGAWIW